MTKTLDTHEIRALAYAADSIAKFVNAQGRFWHNIDRGKYTRRPSDLAKGSAYDGASRITQLLDGDRASNMLDLIRSYDLVRDTLGVGTVRLTEANRATVISHVTPRS